MKFLRRHCGALNLLTLSVQDGGPKDAVSAASQGIPSDPCAYQLSKHAVFVITNSYSNSSHPGTVLGCAFRTQPGALLGMCVGSVFRACYTFRTHPGAGRLDVRSAHI